MPLCCILTELFVLHLFMTFRRFLLASSTVLFLAACGVDTTGLSPDLHNEPHPSTSANAAVTVMEYADFQCPACKAAHTVILKPLVEKYGTQIRYEFHHMPLSSIHRFAIDAAEAAECSADQGKFWEFADIVFERQDTLSREALTQWGRELELDMELFERCRDSHIKRDGVIASYDEGREKGVTGTPTFFVNGTRVESDIAAISAAIDEAVGTAGQRL